MTGLERNPMAGELIGEPSHAERRVAKHTGRNPSLLDLGILVHDAADPTQVDIERLHRPAADDDAGRRAIIGHRIENLARVLQTRIDDLDRGTTYSVARSTSARPTPGPFRGRPMMNASSISTRGRQ